MYCHLNTSGQWIYMPTPLYPQVSGTVSRYSYSVQIPAGETEVKVRLVPIFDWLDEGVLFDPSGSGTPWDDVGEFAHLEITNVYWPGLSSNTINWNPIDRNKMTDKVEIKDGAICLIMTDSNNDGAITMVDRDAGVKNNPQYPGRVLRVNNDDDDKDGVLDRLQRPTRVNPNDPDPFTTPMNGAALNGTAPKVNVQGEDDLAAVILYAWIDPQGVGSHSIDVYSIFPNDLVMWTESTKGSRLHRGVIDTNTGQVIVDTKLATLTSGANNNVFERIVFMEANAEIVGNVELHAKFTDNHGHASGFDSSKMTGFVFDADMNTDNFDGTSIVSTPTMPARNAREELYQDHEYGLGIVMLTDDPLTSTVEPPQYYPLVIEVTASMVGLSVSPTISFEHVVASEPGGVEIYKKVNGNYQLLQPNVEYTLQQLEFTGASSTIVLYVLPKRKHMVVSEWRNPSQFNSKPDSKITVTFHYNQVEIKENIRYIVSSQGSFWNNYLHEPSIRHAFAAQGVYGSDADTPSAHASPTSLDMPQFALQWINDPDDLAAMGFDAATIALLGANDTNGLNVCVYYDHITGNAILAFQGSDPLALAKPIFVSSGLFTQQQIDSWSDSKLIRKLRATAKINEALGLLASGAIHGSSAPDWVCNIGQSLGLVTPQYDNAMTLASNLPKNFVTINNAISISNYTGWTITGHSLGGGLASAAAGVCGNLAGPQSIGHRVDTFNAAGLHANTVNSFLTRNSLSTPALVHGITAYRTESDELTEGQEEYVGYSSGIPNAAGAPYWLEDFVNDGDTGALSSNWPGHEMKSVIQGLLVDRIGKQLGVLYIIDYDGDICYRGNHKQPSTGTIKIGTTPYAF